MNILRVIEAIEGFQNAEGRDEAVRAMNHLNAVKYELRSEVEQLRATGAVTLPEGFADFAMRAMKRALELRKSNDALYAVAYATPEGGAFWIVPGEGIDIKHCVETAALALLHAVEPPTLEGQANGKN